MMYSAISTSRHLPILCSQRPEVGLVVMGTAATVEITLGIDDALPTALWFREPDPSGEGSPPKGMPVLTPATEVDWNNDSFLARESKLARRWLYDKGLMLPQEERNPVDTELESFLSDVRSGKRPRAGVEVGLADATAVILSNLAMEENRRVYFKEIETMGLPAPPAPVPVKPSTPVTPVAVKPDAAEPN
jgi:hypothetical protein